MKSMKLSFLWLVIAAFLLNFMAQAIHEGAHLLVYAAGGHGPVWGFTSLVQVWDTPPQHPETWVETTAPDGERGWLKLASNPTQTESNICSAVGPLASLLSVITGLLVFRYAKKTSGRTLGLVLALITSLLMCFYYARSGGRTSGDEGFLAASLGIPKWTLDLPMGLAFAACFLLSLVSIGNWKTALAWLGGCILGMIASAVPMVLADPLIRAGVERGSPWLRPVLGFSLPVFATYVAAMVGLFFVHRIISPNFAPAGFEIRRNEGEQ
jgi:hypothetical protein